MAGIKKLNPIDFIGNGSSGSYAHPDIDDENSVANRASRLTVNGTSTGTIIHRYPLFVDRGNQRDDKEISETARECIRFTVVKQGGVTFKDGDIENSRKRALEGDIQNATNTINTNNVEIRNLTNQATPVSGDPNIVGKETQERIESLRNQIATAKSDRAKLIEDGDNVSLVSTGVELFKTIGSRARSKPQNIEHCFLYMPPSIVYNETATWGMEALGSLGNFARQAIKGGTIGNLLTEFGAGIAPGLAKAAAVGVGAKIAGAFGALGTALGGGGIVSGVSSAARVVQNPYEEQLFTGIGFRVFNFNFEFIATSETEFKEVSKILKMFRKHSRPTFSIDADADGNQNEALYSYPNEFAIEFMHLNESDVFVRNKYLPKLHNCVLTNITTNFAPDGWLAHDKGEPVSIVVQLAFTETIKNTANDIDKGY